MSDENPLGLDCKLYHDDVANWDTPAATEIVEAVDVNQPGITKNMVSLASRGSKGWDVKGAAMRSMDVSFGYLYTAGGDTVLDTLRDSFLNNTVLVFFVLDGPIEGLTDRTVEGFRFPGIVSEYPINQELEDGQRLELKADLARKKNGAALILPEWYEVAATGGV